MDIEEDVILPLTPDAILATVAHEIPCPHSIEWATYGQTAPIQDVSVDHGRLDVFVTQQFLDGAEVVVIFQQVRGKGVAEGMGRDPFGDASLPGSFLDGFLHSILVAVMATNWY